MSQIGVYGHVPFTEAPTKKETRALRNYLQESIGIFVDHPPEPLAPLPPALLPPAPLAINQQEQIQALLAQLALQQAQFQAQQAQQQAQFQAVAAALVNQQQVPANHHEEEEEEEEEVKPKVKKIRRP